MDAIPLVEKLSLLRYTRGLFKKAYKKNDLDENDLYEVLDSCNSKKCGDKLEKIWISGTEKGISPSIHKILWQGYGKRYLLWGCVEVLWKILKSLLEPNAVSSLISYFNPEQTKVTQGDAYYYAALVLFLNIANSIFYHNYDLVLISMGFEMKAGFSSLLYRKCLKLNPMTLSEISVGNLITLMTKDINIFTTISIFFINDLWIGIVQIFIAVYLLYSKIGMASLIGTGVFLIAIPMQVYLGIWINKLRLQTGSRTDERLQITQEVLSKIKTIKMYTWEEYFKKKINEARREEMRRNFLGFFLKYILLVTGMIVSKLGFYFLLMGYIWMGNATDTTLIFYILTNFTSLRHFLGYLLPENIGTGAQVMSALSRINKVIQLDESPLRTIPVHPVPHPVVELREASVNIGKKEIFNKINFKAEPGLTIITGSVGTGKSTLVRAILQDYPLTTGKLVTTGRISYASQDPWLFPSSIRQNILFGQKLDEGRYQEVVSVCALCYDFRLLDKGDETIVCDRGMNLSKGQQARVNLARAIYKESDIYLVDDSLSALDPHVRDYIFAECIEKYLKDKICILVSHCSNHVQRGNMIFNMDEGSIIDARKTSLDIGRQTNIGLFKVGNSIEEEHTNKKVLKTELATERKIYSEFQKKGQVDVTVYKKYIFFGGGFLLLLLNLILVGATQGADSYCDKLLTEWVDEKQTVINIEALKISENVNDFANTSMNSTFYMKKLDEAESLEITTFNIYTIMMIISMVLSITKTYVLLDFCRRASVNIHESMVHNVIHAVMSFFDHHFIGNILNRFSKDLANIDEPLPFVLTACFVNIFSIIGIVILIATVNTMFLIYASIVICLLVVMGKCYLPAGRSLKRLEAMARSPMIGHLNSTLEGLTTIKSCGAQTILRDEFDKHQDLHTSAHFTSICALRAFSFFMDALCSVFTVLVVMKFILLGTDTSAGNVGLALTQVFMLGGTIQGSVRQWTELENLMTSVERVLEYSEIEKESDEEKTAKQWSTQASVQFEDVSLAYNNELVLKNLTFNVEPEQKIGIVGRTGAGKSSIISVLFRLYDFEGKIIINGVDINALSLKFLRRKLGIIPQDPILFSGTLRSNLDPFGDYSDQDLWRVVRAVGLKNCVSLDLQVTSDDSIFSLGQKQLVCLARVILRKSKILIMDEASSNMDPATDTLLQTIIEENFLKCTVFTIAHRMNSILKCDRVIVLDKGEIKEFGEPLKLLEIKNGIFYDMVSQAE